MSLASPLVDKALKTLVTRSFRRGWAGEPIWIAVGVAAWLVTRSRRKDSPVVWSGPLQVGDRLVITSRGPGQIDSEVLQAD
ncbi:MAG: hypothetical protein WAM97_04285 [Acidimicrobiales bacterium]|jgi:hypothetical protein